MKLFELFKRSKEVGDAVVYMAGATLYPDKILIETTDIVKEGFGISSSKVSLLSVDASASELGTAIKLHLAMTRRDLNRPTDYKEHYRAFLSASGFKSEKDHHKGALHVSVYQNNDKISLQASSNEGKGFSFISEGRTEVSVTITDEALGNAVKAVWKKCK